MDDAISLFVLPCEISAIMAHSLLVRSVFSASNLHPLIFSFLEHRPQLRRRDSGGENYGLARALAAHDWPCRYSSATSTSDRYPARIVGGPSLYKAHLTWLATIRFKVLGRIDLILEPPRSSGTMRFHDLATQTAEDGRVDCDDYSEILISAANHSRS